eukprot:gene32026-41534_t
MFHWGVSKADGDYHVGWQKHRSPGDTANSIQNIKNAIAEFQQRSIFDNRLDYWKCLKYNCSKNHTINSLHQQVDISDMIGPENSAIYDRNDVIFLFLSSLWDAHRFYYKYSSKYWFTKFLDYYQNDYTSLMLDLIPTLRVNDTLVLQTQHKTRPWHPTIPSTLLMNTRVQKIANFFRLPVLDVYKLLGENEAAYLQDKHHQSAPYSRLIAQSIGTRNWTTPDDCSCSSVCPT